MSLAWGHFERVFFKTIMSYGDEYEIGVFRTPDINECPGYGLRRADWRN